MKILVVTDLTPNRNGFAAPQTLHNLLQLLGGEYLIVANHLHLKESGIDSAYPNFTTYKERINLFFRNRLENYIAPIRNYINKKWIYPNNRINSIIESFKPDQILIVPNSIDCIYSADLLVKRMKKQPFVYFMDDYQYYQSLKHREYISNFFKTLKGGLFISEQLKTVFYKEYAIKPSLPYCLVHNPVDLDRLMDAVKHWQIGEPLKMVYAGSIYPNHKDSLLLLIEAISDLSLKGLSVLLTIYTQQAFWDTLQLILTREQCLVVEYGGQLKYDDLHTALHQHHVGIVTESHLPELKSMASSSLQTKVNDYFLAGLPVWCFGPDYGACRQFIVGNGIGDSFISNNARELANTIMASCNTNHFTLIQENARAFFIKYNDSVTYKSKINNFLNA